MNLHAVNFDSIQQKSHPFAEIEQHILSTINIFAVMRALFWGKWVKNGKFFAIFSGAQKNEYILC
jgi:hypothetical protein